MSVICHHCKREFQCGPDTFWDHENMECSQRPEAIIERLTVENKKLKSQLRIAKKGIKNVVNEIEDTASLPFFVSELLESIEERGRRKK